MNKLHLQYKSELIKLKEELVNSRYSGINERSPVRDSRRSLYPITA